MKLIVVFAAVVLAVNASSDFDQWVAFKQAHGKTYKNLVEEQHRFSIFRDNLRTIEAHNAKYEAGESLYTMGVNQFSDMTREEFKQRLGSHPKPTLNATLKIFDESVAIPTSVDWREKAVLRVKNQGNCGSCWAFSATGALEGQNAIINGKKIALSEQQLLDCSGDYGNGDCDKGGDMAAAFEYVKDHGIEAGFTYPYIEKWTKCVANTSNVVLKAKGYKRVEATEAQLAQAVATIGPISVGIDGDDIMYYRSGIFDSDCHEAIDHGVLAVGYGEENGVKYWIVKNSWGVFWGDSGYIRIKKDAGNLCNISSDATYPLI